MGSASELCGTVYNISWVAWLLIHVGGVAIQSDEKAPSQILISMVGAGRKHVLCVSACLLVLIVLNGCYFRVLFWGFGFVLLLWRFFLCLLLFVDVAWCCQLPSIAHLYVGTLVEIRHTFCNQLLPPIVLSFTLIIGCLDRCWLLLAWLILLNFGSFLQLFLLPILSNFGYTTNVVDCFKIYKFVPCHQVLCFKRVHYMPQSLLSMLIYFR